MPPVVIENPILNSPYREPTRHFRDESGQIVNVIEPGRRGSSYFLPIAAPKKKGKPGLFDDYAARRGPRAVTSSASGDCSRSGGSRAGRTSRR